MSQASHLLIHSSPEKAEYISMAPQQAGWDLLHFAARKMKGGEQWQHNTGENELALVVLGGTCKVQSSRGEWASVGRRSNVFSGMPYTLYLPRRTEFSVEALNNDLDIAYGWCETNEDHPARLIRPEDASIEIRGGGNATRQINGMIPPGFDCHRLVVVEVYTPPGNWSSYPPHKHDVHRMNADGSLEEADLEEVYFYKINSPEGYAYQRVYSPESGLDELMMAGNNDLVLVPEGYHPVVSAHGYTTYYLNILAGSAQSLASFDDPQYAWIKTTWDEKDPRLPLVSMAMES